jgi:hypothetical protein
MPWVSFPTGVGESGEPLTQALERQLIYFNSLRSSRVGVELSSFIGVR